MSYSNRKSRLHACTNFIEVYSRALNNTEHVIVTCCIMDRKLLIACVFATLWMVCSITGADVAIQDGFADSLRDSKLQEVKGEKNAQDFKFFLF